MNDKENELYRIVDIVVECCAQKVDDDGTMSVTKEEVLGKSRKENVVMTRVILAEMIVYAGYSVTTAAQLMHHTNAAVRKLLAKAQDFRRSGRAFRIAEAEATRRCNAED